MNCPTCNGELKPVIQPAHMDFASFAKNKAGDFYCETCPSLKGKGYRHFWTHQLPKEFDLKKLYTLNEIAAMKLSGMPEKTGSIYHRANTEKWPFEMAGKAKAYALPSKYTDGVELPDPTVTETKPGSPKPRAKPKRGTLQDSAGKILVHKPVPAPGPFNGIDLPLLGLVTVKLSQWESKHGLLQAEKRNQVTHLMYDYALKSQDQNAAIDFVLKVLS